MGKSVKPVKTLPNIPIAGGDSFYKSGYEYNKYDAGLTELEYEDKMKFRQARQGVGEAVANMLGQVLTTVAGQTIQGIDALTIGGLEALSTIGTDKPTDFSSPIGDFGRSIENWGRSEMPIWYDKSAGFGSLNYILGNLPNVASTVSMLIPQLGAARLIGGIGKALRASQIATSLAQVGGGAMVGRHIEGTMEAARVYEDAFKSAKEYGLSDEEASRNASEAAVTDYQMNYANIVFDVVQLGSILKPLKAMPKIGTAGSRLDAVSKVGFEAANKRAISMGFKSILDGASIYEKAAIQAYRYTAAGIGQVTEGIEEFWNTTAQRESLRQASLDALEQSNLKYDDPERYESERKALKPDSTMMERIKEYTGDDEFKDSFIWGWIGGGLYAAAGKPIAKAVHTLGKDKSQFYGSIKAKDFAERNKYINEHLTTMADPKASDVDKMMSVNQNIFTLAESALRTGNMDVLIEDLNDDAYVAFIAKQNNIDIETAKTNVKELQATLQDIASDYNGFVGYNFDGYKGYQDYVKVNPYGDLVNNKYDFGERIEPSIPMVYSVKEIGAKLEDGQKVRIDLNLKNEKGEDVPNFVIATKKDGKLTVNGQDFSFSDREITDARYVTEVKKEEEQFDVKRKGLFGFVDPNVGIHLTRLSYFSKKAAKESSKAGLEAIKLMNERYADSNQFVVGIGDLAMKSAVTANRINRLNAQLNVARKSKVSEEKIEDIKQDLKEATERATALTQQMKAQETLINDLIKDDFQVSNGVAFAGDTAKNIKAATLAMIADKDLLELYNISEGHNVVKKEFARQRQRIIKDPTLAYKRYTEDTTKMKEYEEVVAKERKVYDILESDTEEVKTKKRQIVDLFKPDASAKDPGYNEALAQLLKDLKAKYVIEFNANKPETTRIAELQKEIDEYKKTVTDDKFDIKKLIELQAELAAIREVMKIATPVATSVTSTSGTTSVNNQTRATLDGKFVTGANVFFDIASDIMGNLDNLKNPNEYTIAEQEVVAGILDPFLKIQRITELLNKASLSQTERVLVSDIIFTKSAISVFANIKNRNDAQTKQLNDASTKLAEINKALHNLDETERAEFERLLVEVNAYDNLSPLSFVTINDPFIGVINAVNGTVTSMEYSQDLVKALRDSIEQVANQYSTIESLTKDSKLFTPDEAKRQNIKEGDPGVKAIYSPWNYKTFLAGEPVFDFMSFVLEGLPKAKDVFAGKAAEIINTRQVVAPIVPVAPAVKEATKEDFEAGLASSLEPEPDTRIDVVSIISELSNKLGQFDASPDVRVSYTNKQGDRFVDVWGGYEIISGFDAEGRPIVGDNYQFDPGIMNPDMAGGALLQSGDTIEVRREDSVNNPGEFYYKVYKLGKDNSEYYIGRISDSTKSKNTVKNQQSIAAEQAFAKLFEQSKKEQSTNIDLVNETNALLNSLPDVVMNSQDNPEPLKKIIKWAEKVYGVEFKGDFKKGEYVSFFQGLDNAGYLASSKISGPKSMLQELIKGATYQAKIKGNANDSTNDIRIKELELKRDKELLSYYGNSVETLKGEGAPKEIFAEWEKVRKQRSNFKKEDLEDSSKQKKWEEKVDNLWKEAINKAVDYLNEKTRAKYAIEIEKLKSLPSDEQRNKDLELSKTIPLTSTYTVGKTPATALANLKKYLIDVLGWENFKIGYKKPNFEIQFGKENDILIPGSIIKIAGGTSSVEVNIEDIINARYNAQSDSKKIVEEIKAIRFKLDYNSVGFGRLIQTEVIDAETGYKKPLSLFDITDLTKINNKDATDSMHLGLFDGSEVGVRDGSMKEISIPNGVVMSAALKPELSGQVIAIVPTNTIYPNDLNPSIQGKQAYIQVPLVTSTLSSIKVNGMTMPSLVLQKLADPASNIEFMKQLGNMIGVRFGDVVNEDTISEFYTEKNLIKIFGHLMFLKGALKGEGVAARNYKFPVNVDTRIDKDTGVFELQISNVTQGGKENKTRIPIIIPNAKTSAEAQRTTINANIQAFEELFLVNKPFAVNSTRVGDGINGGPYVGFAIVNGEIAIKKYDSYLHYLNENRIVTGTFASVQLRGQNRRTFFKNPRVVINFERSEIGKTAASKVTVGNALNQPTVTVSNPVIDNKPNSDSSIDRLQTTVLKTAVLNKVTNVYDAPNGPHDRVSTIIKTSIPSTPLLEKANTFGTVIDEAAREFFDNGIINFSNYPEIEEFANELLKGLNEFKNLLDSRGETVIKGINTVYGTLKDSKGVERKIGGATDIITVDKQNRIRIYDMKSMNEAVTEQSVNKKIKSWDDQLNMYAELLKSQGYTIESVSILPISIMYSEFNDKISGMTFKGSTIDIPLNNAKLEYKAEDRTIAVPSEPTEVTPSNQPVMPMDLEAMMKRMSENLFGGPNNKSSNQIQSLLNLNGEQSLYDVLIDPSIPDSIVRHNLLNITTSAIIDVLFDQTVVKRNGDISVEKSLKPKVKALITKQMLDYKQQMIEAYNNNDEKSVERLMSYVLYRERLLKSFDSASYEADDKYRLGDFAGYFKSAYVMVSSSKVVENKLIDGMEDDSPETAVSTQTPDITKRMGDDVLTKINPKNTVSFQAKLFLSRIPIRDDNGSVVLDDTGTALYYGLDSMLQRVYAYMDQYDPTMFSDDGTTLFNLFKHTKDRPMLDLVQQLQGMNSLYTENSVNVIWPFTREQMMYKLSDAFNKHSRNTKILEVDYEKLSEKEVTGGVKMKVFNTNRQNVAFQIRSEWATNIKETLDDLYIIRSETVDGLISTRIKDLAPIQNGFYETVSNSKKDEVITFDSYAVESIEENYTHKAFINAYIDLNKIKEDALRNPGKKFYVKLNENEDISIKDELGNVKGSLTRGNVVTLLSMVDMPNNVLYPKTVKGDMKSSMIGNVTQSISDLLNMSDSTESYSPYIYHMLAYRLATVGINISEDLTNAGNILMMLQQSSFKNVPQYKKLDAKATSLKDFLRKTLLDNILNRMADLADMSEVDVENPLANLGMALDKLARLSVPGHPALVNPNSTSIFGENEFTIIDHTYMSYKSKMLKNNKEVRDYYLNVNPLTKDNLHIKQMLEEGKALETFDIHDIRGINFNKNNKVSNKHFNENQRRVMDYLLFQNNETVDTKGRGVGYFTTMHGESTTVPAVSMEKINIDYTFVVDENNKVELLLKKDTALYDILVSQFRGELNMVLETQKIFDTIKKVEQTKGFEQAVEFAKKNYLAEKHYNIVGNTIKPGNRMRFYRFGKDMFEDKGGRIYDPETGNLNSFFQSLLDDKKVLGEINADRIKLINHVFGYYINDFLNSMINEELKVLSKVENEYFRNQDVAVDKRSNGVYGNKVAGVMFPLFDNSYTYNVARRLLFGGSDANESTKPLQFIRKNGDYQEAVNTSDLRDSVAIKNLPQGASTEALLAINAENETVRTEETLFRELQKHYVASDMILNYLVFYNSYDALYADDASFAKADNYFALMEERNKRNKTLMGPGAISAGNMIFDVNNIENTNLVYNHIVQDVKVSDLKIDVLVSELESDIKHSELISWVKGLPNNKQTSFIKAAFNFSNPKVYTVPTNYNELASHYVINKNVMTDKELQEMIYNYLNQEMTDGGSVIDLRERVARLVKKGDVDITRAPKLYVALSNENLTYDEFENIMKEYGLNRHTFQIDKFIHSGTTANTYKHDKGQFTSDDFVIIKDSEITFIPAFVKNSPWAPLLKDANTMLESFLRSKGIDPLSEKAFYFGNKISPKSTAKASHTAPVKVFNDKGQYVSGSLRSGTPMVLSREYSRQQGGKTVKEDNMLTASSQLMQMSLIAIDSLADFGTNNSYGLQMNRPISGRDISDMRYWIEDQFTERELTKVFNKMGVALENKVPIIKNMALFIKSMSDQVVNQQGVGLHLETFSIQKDGFLRAPLSYTPFNVIAQNVLMSQFDKVVRRKISGFSLIQSSTVGIFNRSDIQIDSSLKGSSIDIVDSGKQFFSENEARATYAKGDIHNIYPVTNAQGDRVYKVNLYKVNPSEIAIGWNLRNADGELLKYEDYVDPITMMPRPGKIDEKLLHTISYRTPNTPHNTTAYTKIVKFLPPMYKDVVIVNPQLMTAMSSDLDVDVLGVMFFKFTVDENGNLQKIQGINHKSQKDYDALLNSSLNKEAVKERMLMSNYDYARLKYNRDKKMSKFLKFQDIVQGIIDNETISVEEKVKRLKSKGLDTSDISKLLKDYRDLEKLDPVKQLETLNQVIDEGNLIEHFHNEYFDILDTNPEMSDDDALSELKKYVKSLRKQYRKEASKFQSGQLDAIEASIASELKDIKQDIEEGSTLSIIELDAELDSIRASVLNNFEFNFSRKSIYQKQSDDQLNNNLIDTFMLQYSSPEGYRLSSQPLSVNLLKEKVEEKNLFRTLPDGTIEKLSIYDIITAGQFKALNSYTSNVAAYSAAKDNGEMIGIAANTLRGLQYSSAGAFYVQNGEDMPNGIKYAYSKEVNGMLVTDMELVNGQYIPRMKTEDTVDNYQLLESAQDTSIYKPGDTVYNYTNPAFRSGGSPDTSTRFRLDRIYHIDNRQNKSYVHKILLQTLQAVLDGVKDPIASKMGLNTDNINAYIGHVMLGYFDEIIPMFHLPIIKDYIQDVVKDHVEKKTKSKDAINAFVQNYIKSNNIAGLGEYNIDSESIYMLEDILKNSNIVISEATMNQDLITSTYGTANERNNEFHKRQLLALLNYLKAEKIGNNMTTVIISLNAYAQGLSGNLLELDEKMSKYKLLRSSQWVYNKITQKDDFVLTSSAPLIGNIPKLSKDFRTKHPIDQAISNANISAEHTYDNVVGPLLNLMKKLNSSELFTELSPVNKMIYEMAGELLNIESSAKAKTDLALSFESFMYSNPELYRHMFTDAEYLVFKKYGIEALTFRNDKINPELNKAISELENPNVFINDLSLPDFIKQLKKKKTPLSGTKGGVSYKTVYKLLGSLKEIANNNKLAIADKLTYMNNVDYKNGFNSEFMMTISQMLAAEDPEVKAAAKQMILYAFMSGGISSPNSYIKFISQLDMLPTLQVLRDKLKSDNVKAADGRSKSKLNNMIITYLAQYVQHNPSKAKLLGNKYRTGQFNAKTNKIEYKVYDSKTERIMIPVRKEPNDFFYYKKRPIIKEESEEGGIKLFMFQMVEGIPYYVSMDKAGESRYNFREYQYNEDRIPVSSVILKNVVGGKKGMKMQQVSEEAMNESKRDPNEFVNFFGNLDATANTLRTAIADDSTGYYSLIPQHQVQFAKYIIDAKLYDIRIKSEQMDGWQFGTYDRLNNYISLNAEYIKEYGGNNIERVIEVINHELTHAAIDRSITSWLDPMFRVKDANNNDIEYLSDLQKQSINQPMKMLSSIIEFMHSNMGNSKSKYYKLLRNVADRYKAAQEAGDTFTMKDLAFYPAVLQKLQQYTKAYGPTALSSTDKMSQQQTLAYSEIMREFVAYFMTNSEFQKMLNEIKLEKAENPTNATLWHQIVKAFLDILDVITGGLRPLSEKQKGFLPNVDDNTLAHATAIASFDLIDATTGFRKEMGTEYFSKGDNTSRYSKIKQSQIIPILIQMDVLQNGLYVIESAPGYEGPNAEIASSPNVFQFPVKKAEGNMPEAFYTDADIPTINKNFDTLIARAKEFANTYGLENIGSSDLADYSSRNKNVAAAFAAGFVRLREALSTTSKNAIELIDVDNDLYAPVIVTKIADNVDKILRWSKIKGINLWSKIQKDLQIPKIQIDLLKESDGNSIEEKLTSFISNYSYTVEINTAKTTEINNNPIDDDTRYYEKNGKYYKSTPYENEAQPLEITKKQYESYTTLNIPTQHYSNLTVNEDFYKNNPDWEYKEQRITTPLITPSIKGHAQFAEVNDIGWFRAWYNKKTGEVHVLEVQSDLFQKGRDKQLLVPINEKVALDHMMGNTSQEMKELLNSNSFLQLLNKDNNWVTFFVKAIIQDSAKKGYEKVLFPKGDTASKVEGHTTLEEFKKQKQNRLKELKSKLENPEYSIDYVDTSGYSDLNIKFNTEQEALDYIKTKNAELPEDAEGSYQIVFDKEGINREITQLEQELTRVEKEGFAALKPIYKFYEETVGNILKKQYKDKVSEIKDEYGNGWYSLQLDGEMANAPTRNLDLIKDLLDFKFDMAEVEEVSAYKNCTK